jgi:hypothetical protein
MPCPNAVSFLPEQNRRKEIAPFAQDPSLNIAVIGEGIV